MPIILKRIVAAVLIVLFTVLLIARKEEYKQAKIKELNEVGPSAFNELVAVTEGHPISTERLKAYLNYFKAIADLTPTRVDAVALQGFCFYHLGNYDEALKSYEKAIQLNPQFLGYRYNLAVIYFKKHQYSQSLEQTQQVLTLNPKQSVVYILSFSKVYAFMMLDKMNNYGKSLEQQVQETYQKAYVLKTMDQVCLQTAKSPITEERITLEGY